MRGLPVKVLLVTIFMALFTQVAEAQPYANTMAPSSGKGHRDVTYEKVTASQSDWSGTYLLVYDYSSTTGWAFDGSISSGTGGYTSLTVSNGVITSIGAAKTITIAKYSEDASYYTIYVDGVGYLHSGYSGFEVYDSPSNNPGTTSDSYYCYWLISYSTSGMTIYCPGWNSIYYLRFMNYSSSYSSYRYFAEFLTTSDYYSYTNAVSFYKETSTTSITVSPTTATVFTGYTTVLTATTVDTGDASIVWSSSDSAVATVVSNSDNATATVTGVAEGTAIITASITVDGDTYSATSTITVEAPHYCTPAPTSIDGTGIHPVSFGTGSQIVNNTSYPTASPYYGDYSSMIGAEYQGNTVSVSITYNTGSYDYGTLIWVDWDQSYTFDDDEIVAKGTSASGSSTEVFTFQIPSNQPVGYYRMRIGAADSYFDSYIQYQTNEYAHDPCSQSTWAVFHDYTLSVLSSGYSVTTEASPAEGGTVTASPDSGLTGDDNETVTLTVTTNPGYTFNSISAVDADNDEVSLYMVSEGSEYTFTMPASDVTVTATYDAINYTVQTEALPSGKGLVLVNGSASLSNAHAGTTITVTATPIDGYYAESVYYMAEGSNTQVAIVGGSFTMPAANVTVYAEFDEGNYVTVGEGSTTSGSGVAQTPFGSAGCYNEYHQITYLASQLQGLTSISSISFYYDGAEAVTRDSISIYVAQCDRLPVNWLSNVDFDITTVYGDTHTGTGSGGVGYGSGESYTFNPGWNTFPISSPFNINPCSNLVVIVKDNSKRANDSSSEGLPFLYATNPSGINVHLYTSNTEDSTDTWVIPYNSIDTYGDNSQVSIPTSSTSFPVTRFEGDKGAKVTVSATAVPTAGISSLTLTDMNDATNTVTSTASASISVHTGTRVRVEATVNTEDGFIWNGWYSDEECTQLVSTDQVLFSDCIGDALSLYAKTHEACTDNPEGIIMEKTVEGNFSDPSADDYGTGTITLENYVTGNVITTTTGGGVPPIDFVFVLDYSASMNNTYDGTVTRKEAMNNAVDAFLDVLTQADMQPTYEGYTHRVAFMAFDYYGNTYFNNEGAIHDVIYQGGNTYKLVTNVSVFDANYNSTNITEVVANDHYGKAFFTISDTDTQATAAWTAIKERSIGNSTTINYSMHDLSEKVFALNSNAINDTDYPELTERKRVVVVLTDGYPQSDTWTFAACNSTSGNVGCGNTALSYAYNIKNTQGADIYAIGIFSGADASATTYPTYHASSGTGYADENANLFLHLLSSNSKEALSFCYEGDDWSNKGYYKSPSDATSLVNDFTTIAQTSSQGTALYTLTETAVVKDIMADEFVIPSGVVSDPAQVSVTVYEATGTNYGSTPFTADDPDYEQIDWQQVTLDPAPSLTVTSSGIEVKGVNFSDHPVVFGQLDGDSEARWHGYKLKVEIPITLTLLDDPNTSTLDDPGYYLDGDFVTNKFGSGVWVYDESLEAYHLVAGFCIPTTTVDWGPDTWVRAVHEEPSDWDIDNIDSEDDLAWLISYVNGYNGSSAHPNASATVTTDLDMNAHIWVPIGINGTNYFGGSFDGNGHVIDNLRTEQVKSANTGMFGYTQEATIQNALVTVNFQPTDVVHLGTFVGTMNGGTLSNVEAAGLLQGTDNTVNIGGLVGRSLPYDNTLPEIHSGFSVNTIKAVATNSELPGGTIEGGLVGTNNGKLFNSYANAALDNDNVATVVGGLVGVNDAQGTAENCYVANPINANASLAYTNSGVIQYCYAPTDASTTVSDGEGTQTGNGTYDAVADHKAYGYLYYDNAVTASGNDYVADEVTYAGGKIATWPGLLSTLNQWVEGHNGYTKWFRPTSPDINGDLPVLGFAFSNSLATTDGKFLDYSDGFDTQLSDNTSNTAYLFLYDTATEVANVPGTNVNVFVNEDAVLLQANDAGAFINTTVGVSFDNSNKSATDYWGTTLSYDWHFLSTPLADAPLGISYNSDAQNWWEANDEGQVTGVVNSYMPDGTENLSHWDFYTYYEPQYHWINFKRNSSSHHHYDEPHGQIAYTNETNLVPGKGYMAAIDKDSYLNNTGTLNGPTNDITINLTCSGELPEEDDPTKDWGFNLLGNPYQAYLNMEDFLNGNELSSYWVYIAEQNKYVAGNPEASENPDLPSATLHPHQAFFVRTNEAKSVNFTYDMATADPNGYSHFRGTKVNYPLVNLYATSENGQRDFAVVEFNRPTVGGSSKLKVLDNTDFALSAHLGDRDYSILFTEEGTDRVPLHFNTRNDGTYTFTWKTMHGTFTGLYLIDNKTGVRTDMLHNDHYTFNATADDYASRFYITFRVTDVDDYNAADGDDFAFFNGNEWVVNGEGYLQLIDVTGRVLQAHQLSGEQSRFHFDHYAAGVYLLRLGSATQKIVIR